MLELPRSWDGTALLESNRSDHDLLCQGRGFIPLLFTFSLAMVESDKFIYLSLTEIDKLLCRCIFVINNAFIEANYDKKK